jgi:hypothetical protein
MRETEEYRTVDLEVIKQRLISDNKMQNVVVIMFAFFLFLFFFIWSLTWIGVI